MTIEELQALWQSGRSMTQIAAHYSISRNAVSGFISRARAKGNIFAPRATINALIIRTPEEEKAIRLARKQAIKLGTKFSLRPVKLKKVDPVAQQRPSRNDGIKYPPLPEPESFKNIVFQSIEMFHPIIALESHNCKWPFGDPLKWRTGEFRYCMALKPSDQPYCEEHQGRVSKWP